MPSETIPYDWEEHDFKHDGTSSDTHGHTSNIRKAATKLKDEVTAAKRVAIIIVPEWILKLVKKIGSLVVRVEVKDATEL